MRNRNFNLLNILALIPLICCPIILLCTPAGIEFFGMLGLSEEAYKAFTTTLGPIINVANILFYVSIVLQTIIALGVFFFGGRNRSANATFLGLTVLDLTVFISTFIYLITVIGDMFAGLV